MMPAIQPPGFVLGVIFTASVVLAARRLVRYLMEKPPGLY